MYRFQQTRNAICLIFEINSSIEHKIMGSKVIWRTDLYPLHCGLLYWYPIEQREVKGGKQDHNKSYLCLSGKNMSVSFSWPKAKETFFWTILKSNWVIIHGRKVFNSFYLSLWRGLNLINFKESNLFIFCLGTWTYKFIQWAYPIYSIDYNVVIFNS